MDRRQFLVAATAMMVSNYVRAAPVNPYAWVRLTRFGQSVWVNLDTPDGYAMFQWLLQDAHRGRVGQPSIMLGYILSWMQQYLYRVTGTLYTPAITSGLRTRESNARLERAALNSLHIPDANGVFRAVDFTIPGIPSEYVGRLAALAQQGGVGFYGNGVAGHTHIDTGTVRFWRDLR